MKITARALTLLFGAAPATYLSFGAALGIYIGTTAVLDGELGGVLFVVWGGAGIYGTLSLWAVGFGFVRPWAVIGLIVGTLALTPLSGSSGFHAFGIRGHFDPLEYLLALALVGPIVVAVAWLSVLTVRAFRKPRASSTTNAART